MLAAFKFAGWLQNHECMKRLISETMQYSTTFGGQKIFSKIIKVAIQLAIKLLNN